MGSRGARSSLSIAQIKAIQKDLTKATANATRLEKQMHIAGGARIGFDWNTPAGTLERFEKVVQEERQAIERYEAAARERDNLQAKLDRIAKSRNRGSTFW